MLRQSRWIRSFSYARLGHGSNIKGLETTATFIPETDEFEIHSPVLTVFRLIIGLMYSLRNGGLVDWESWQPTHLSKHPY